MKPIKKYRDRLRVYDSLRSVYIKLRKEASFIGSIILYTKYDQLVRRCNHLIMLCKEMIKDLEEDVRV